MKMLYDGLGYDLHRMKFSRIKNTELLI